MFRTTVRTLSILTPLALCVCLVAGPVAGAPPRPKADAAKLAVEDIKKNGKLAGGANYWRMAEARFAVQKKTVMAKPLLKPKAGLVAAAGRSSLTVVGGDGVPAGFGKGFTWDRAENEAVLVLFINAADPLGVSIDGLQAGDEVQVMSASGVASYSEDKGNPLRLQYRRSGGDWG